MMHFRGVLLGFALLGCLTLPAMGEASAGSPSGQGNQADRVEPLPEELANSGLNDAARGNQVPMDLSFTDEDGKKVTLGEYFSGDKPVLLTLVYFRCPSICHPVMEETAIALRNIQNMTAGQDFEVLTVSFDPQDTPALAKLTKQQYMSVYARPSGRDGWHFLTGSASNARRLADAVGFEYSRAENGEFAHPPALIVISPKGKVTHFLQGIPDSDKVDSYPRTVRLALVEAADGKIGSAIDWFVLTCFHYDAEAGKYTMQAKAIMTAGGILTVLVLAAFLLPAWVRSSRRKAVGAEESQAPSEQSADADRPSDPGASKTE